MGLTEIWYGSLNSDATITATTEATGYEVERISDFCLLSEWRSTVITVTYIKWAFTAATPIQGLWIEGLSLAAGDTLELQCSTDDFSSTAATQTVTLRTHPRTGVKFAYLQIDWNYQYYRLHLVQAAGTYISITQAHLISYAHRIPQRFNLADQFTVDMDVDETLSAPPSMTSMRRLNGARLIFGFQFPKIDDAELAELQKIATYRYHYLLPTGYGDEAWFGICRVDQATHFVVGPDMERYYRSGFRFSEQPGAVPDGD